MIKKYLTKLLLTIIGAILFIAYMWYRFIRERLPKNIPFNLTEYGCVILIYICCIYLLIIIMLIVTFENNNNDILSRIIDNIYKPLKVFDQSIKEIRVISFYHQKVMVALSTISMNHTKVYYFLNILPRATLISILSVDTFYFHRLENIYKIILIGLLLFLYKYFIYSLKYAKELYILQLEAITNKIRTDYNENSWDTDYSYLYVREFVDIQTDSIFYYNRKYTAYPLPLFPDGTSNMEKMQVEHYRLLDIIIPLSVHIEEFDLRHNYNRKIKYTKIAIFSTYLICWSYILVISMPLLPADAFAWLWIIQDNQEPFSTLNLNNDDND